MIRGLWSSPEVNPTETSVCVKVSRSQSGWMSKKKCKRGKRALNCSDVCVRKCRICWFYRVRPKSAIAIHYPIKQLTAICPHFLVLEIKLQLKNKCAHESSAGISHPSLYLQIEFKNKTAEGFTQHRFSKTTYWNIINVLSEEAHS